MLQNMSEETNSNSGANSPKTVICGSDNALTPTKSDSENVSNEDESPSEHGSMTPNFLDFWQDGSRRSAFSPYTRPATVLTNLQRGNVKTQTSAIIPDLGIHQLAAQGELQAGSVENMDEIDYNGFSPLIWAAAYGQLPTVKMLLEHGADCNITGIHGENCLVLASANGHFEIMKLLISKGMNVNHADKQGNTSLTYATFNNHIQCVEELLKCGADVTHENLLNDSPYSIAIAKGNKHVQAIIEKHLLDILENG